MTTISALIFMSLVLLLGYTYGRWYESCIDPFKLKNIFDIRLNTEWIEIYRDSDGTPVFRNSKYPKIYKVGIIGDVILIKDDNTRKIIDKL